MLVSSPGRLGCRGVSVALSLVAIVVLLAIARGLMARPRLLLLDEPSLGLAPRLVRETFEAVRRIRAEGVSVLVVEQLTALVLQVADRGYVLDRGRVVAQGPAAALAADPRVAAAYLGPRRTS